MNDTSLKNGMQYHLENEDEGYELDFEYNQITTWDRPYKIWFNGELYSYKTFTSARKRVEGLSLKYSLRERWV